MALSLASGHLGDLRVAEHWVGPIHTPTRAKDRVMNIITRTSDIWWEGAAMSELLRL